MLCLMVLVQVASKVLNITATPYRNFLTASIPVHRLYAHVRRLVEKGKLNNCGTLVNIQIL